MFVHTLQRNGSVTPIHTNATLPEGSMMRTLERQSRLLTALPGAPRALRGNSIVKKLTT